MNYYEIKIIFRGERITGLVHQFDTHYLVYFTDAEILKDFSGVFHFTLPEKKFIPGHQRNPSALDLSKLVEGIRSQLH